jgi:hypothetical protein
MPGFAPITMNAPGLSEPMPITMQPVPGCPIPGLQIGVFVYLNGTGNVSVQVTGDPVPSLNGNWVNHDILINLGASAVGNCAYAVTAIRLNVASLSGSVTLGAARWP